MIPNTTCKIHERSGRDVYGRADFRDPVEVACSVVHFINEAARTSRRADAAASMGRALEDVVEGRFLLVPDAVVSTGDILEFNGEKKEVAAVQPQYCAMGSLDHIQVDVKQWRE